MRLFEYADNFADLFDSKEPEINKTAVKEALKAGEKIPGAELGRTQSIIIK